MLSDDHTVAILVLPLSLTLDLLQALEQRLLKINLSWLFILDFLDDRLDNISFWTLISAADVTPLTVRFMKLGLIGIHILCISSVFFLLDHSLINDSSRSILLSLFQSFLLSLQGSLLLLPIDSLCCFDLNFLSILDSFARLLNLSHDLVHICVHVEEVRVNCPSGLFLLRSNVGRL